MLFRATRLFSTFQWFFPFSNLPLGRGPDTQRIWIAADQPTPTGSRNRSPAPVHYIATWHTLLQHPLQQRIPDACVGTMAGTVCQRGSPMLTRWLFGPSLALTCTLSLLGFGGGTYVPKKHVPRSGAVPLHLPASIAGADVHVATREDSRRLVAATNRSQRVNLTSSSRRDSGSGRGLVSAGIGAGSRSSQSRSHSRTGTSGTSEPDVITAAGILIGHDHPVQLSESRAARVEALWHQQDVRAGDNAAAEAADFTVDSCFLRAIHPHTALCAIGVVLLLLWWCLSLQLFLGLELGSCMRFLSTSGDSWRTGPAKERRPHLDNAKLILMLMVVVTHCHVATKGWRWNIPIHLFINPFCTRTFGFISGICSQDGPSLRSFRSLVFRLIMPLVLFSTIYEPAVLPIVEIGRPLSLNEYSQRVQVNLTEAQAGASWYMFALICWRIWSWMLSPLKPGWRLIFASVAASLAGYAELSTFKLHQAIPSFPVFVFGQVFPYEFALSFVPYTRGTILYGVVSLYALYIFGWQEVGKSLLLDLPYWSWTGSGHAFDKQQEICGIFESSFIWVRALFRTVMEMTKCLIFLFAVCPRGRVAVVSDYGAYTLYPFLLHYAFAVAQNRWLPFTHEPPALNFMAWLLLWAAEVFVVTVWVLFLSSPPVRYLFRPLLEPIWLERLVGVETLDRQPKDAMRLPSFAGRASSSAVPLRAQAGVCSADPAEAGTHATDTDEPTQAQLAQQQPRYTAARAAAAAALACVSSGRRQ